MQKRQRESRRRKERKRRKRKEQQDEPKNPERNQRRSSATGRRQEGRQASRPKQHLSPEDATLSFKGKEKKEKPRQKQWKKVLLGSFHFLAPEVASSCSRPLAAGLESSSSGQGRRKEGGRGRRKERGGGKEGRKGGGVG